MKTKFPILILLILLASAGANAASTVKPSINLAEGYIIAEGTGVMPPQLADLSQGIALARLAAKVDAQRNLLEIIGGLQLNSETSVVNLMANDVIRTQVIGILQGAQIVPGSEYFQQGIYHLELRVDIQNLEELLRLAPSTKAAKISTYTGLVIDAQGFSVSAPEVMEIRNTKGELIYTANNKTVQPIPVLKMKKADALADPRLGKNPLVVKVIKISGDGSVVYISDEDGRKVLTHLEGTDVFMLTKIVVFYGGSQ